MSDNVTRIHPAPTIPNPFESNPLAGMTAEVIEAEIEAASARVHAARRTIDMLKREQARRAESEAVTE